jgi:hypothetical protein
MLFIRLATVTYRLRSELNKTVVELTMRPVVLWIGGVSKTKRCKPHLLQTPRAQPSTSNGFPEFLTIRWQFALACRRYGDKNDIVLEQLFLPRSTIAPSHVASLLTYKTDGVQLRDFRFESQAFRDPSHLLSDVLRIARLGAINNQGPARLLCARHCRCNQMR